MAKKIFIKLLLFVSSLLWILISLGILAFKLFNINFISYLEKLYTHNISIFGISILFMIIGIFSLFLVFSKENSKNIILSNIEGGQFTITTNAVSDMVKNAVAQFEDIEPIKVGVKHNKNNLYLDVVATVSTQSNTPYVAETLQHAIKEYVEDCTGLSVKNIKISFKSLNNAELKTYKKLENENINACENSHSDTVQLIDEESNQSNEKEDVCLETKQDK